MTTPDPSQTGEVRFVLALPDLWPGGTVPAVTGVSATAWVEAGDPVLTSGGTVLRTPLRGRLHRIDVVVGTTLAPMAVVAGVAVNGSAGRHYALRYEYEIGMGWALWSSNSEAFHRYDAHVDVEELPISAALQADLVRAADLSAVGWQREVPGQEHLEGDGDEWRHRTPDEEAELAALHPPGLVARLREELGPGYSVAFGGLFLDARPADGDDQSAVRGPAPSHANPAPLRRRLSVTAPPHWFVKESLTFLEPTGQANVIASSEPVETFLETEQYAEVQGELLREEFPGYRELSFTRIELRDGRSACQRLFQWHPPDGVPVQQMQLYFVEEARGYTATATAPVTAFERHLGEFEQILRSLALSAGDSAGTALDHRIF
jgi:hypothetical protein